MQDVMYLDDLEQVKALALPIRVEIMRVMNGNPMTTTQIAQRMRERPGKLYYHMMEMERAGLIELTETRMKGNLVEKYYVPAARFFRINPLIFQNGDSGREAFLGSISSQFDSTYKDIQRHLEDGTLDTDLIDKSLTSIIEGKLSEEQATALSVELRDLVMRHGTTGDGGDVTMHFMTVFYLTRNTEEETGREP